jgi:hypothetical protein
MRLGPAFHPQLAGNIGIAIVLLLSVPLNSSSASSKTLSSKNIVDYRLLLRIGSEEGGRLATLHTRIPVLSRLILRGGQELFSSDDAANGEEELARRIDQAEGETPTGPMRPGSWSELPGNNGQGEQKFDSLSDWGRMARTEFVNNSESGRDTPARISSYSSSSRGNGFWLPGKDAASQSQAPNRQDFPRDAAAYADLGEKKQSGGKQSSGWSEARDSAQIVDDFPSSESRSSDTGTKRSKPEGRSGSDSGRDLRKEGREGGKAVSRSTGESVRSSGSFSQGSSDGQVAGGQHAEDETKNGDEAEGDAEESQGEGEDDDGSKEGDETSGEDSDSEKRKKELGEDYSSEDDYRMYGDVDRIPRFFNEIWQEGYVFEDNRTEPYLWEKVFGAYCTQSLLLIFL